MLSLLYINRTFQMFLWSVVEIFIMQRSFKIRIPWAYQLAFLVLNSFPYVWLKDFYASNQFWELALISFLIFKFSDKVKDFSLRLFFILYVKLGIDIIARFMMFVVIYPFFPQLTNNYFPVLSILIQTALSLLVNELILHYLRMDFLQINELIDDRSVKSSIIYYNIFFIAYFITLWLSYLITPANLGVTYRVNTSTLFMVFLLSFISALNYRVSMIYEKRLILQKENELKYITNYSHQIEELYGQIRSFRHDYSNILASLRYSADNEDLTSIRQTLDEISQESHEILDAQKFEMANLSNITDNALKSVLSSKLSRAIDLKLDVKVEIADPIGLPADFSTLDFVRLVSNLLDNAIEAADESEARQLSLSYFKHGGAFVFILVNSTQSTTENIADLFQLDVSTKGNDRGIGLAIVKQILANYPNAVLKTSSQNGLFTQQLEVEV